MYIQRQLARFLTRSVTWLLPLVLFLLLTCFYLDLPGLHYDEALEAGLPAVRLLNGQNIGALNQTTLRLGQKSFPLMVQNHIGAVQIYAALPFVALGGPSAGALRLMGIVAGALTIGGVYLFVCELHGRTAAFWSCLWLSTFASFVFWSRQGVFVTLLAPCFASWALALGVYWWRTRRLWLLGTAALCSGLAVYSKLSALWLLNAAVLWWLVRICIAAIIRMRAQCDGGPLVVGQTSFE